MQLPQSSEASLKALQEVHHHRRLQAATADLHTRVRRLQAHQEARPHTLRAADHHTAAAATADNQNLPKS